MPLWTRSETHRTQGLVVGQVLSVRPDAVAGHLESIGQRPAPFGCLGGLAPVVGDPHGFAVLQFADGHVPVQASVTVVAGPLDDDNIVELQTPADLQRELGEVALDIGDERALVRTISPICGHWRTALSANGTPRMYATRVAPSDSSWFALIWIMFLPVAMRASAKLGADALRGGLAET